MAIKPANIDKKEKGTKWESFFFKEYFLTLFIACELTVPSIGKIEFK